MTDRFDTNILSGERVLSVNGYKIETQEEVEFILDGLSINERVTLQIVKNGSVRVVNLTLILVKSLNRNYQIKSCEFCSC